VSVSLGGRSLACDYIPAHDVQKTSRSIAIVLGEGSRGPEGARVGRGLGACEPPISLVTGLQPAVPSRPCWGAYLFSSKVSVACGQQLDWCGVRHTRELCGDADPRGHLRESYAPSISMKSTSDLDRHHMPWGFLEHNKSMSPLGAANNHVRLRQSSTRMTTPFPTPPFGGGLFRAAFVRPAARLARG
jgi:hypothetical protein